MIKMAWKFFMSMMRHQFAQWRGYDVFTPPAALSYRTSKCSTCKFNDEEQCSLCKCLVLSKTLLALEECPDGRWHRVWTRRAG